MMGEGMLLHTTAQFISHEGAGRRGNAMHGVCHNMYNKQEDRDQWRQREMASDLSALTQLLLYKRVCQGGP